MIALSTVVFLSYLELAHGESTPRMTKSVGPEEAKARRSYRRALMVELRRVELLTS